METKGKNVLVLGLGVSGFAAAQLLLKQGARVEVRDDSNTDAQRTRAQQLEAQGAAVQLGAPFRNGTEFDFAVLSPGIELTAPILRDALAAGTKVISELEFAFRACRCPVVAITGTNGKTTTTELITAVLNAGGKRAVAAGNIGIPFCEVVPQSEQLDAVVLEVSSFQLETVEKFRPQVSVMMNITPDHLDRYKSMRDYVLAKALIYCNQTETDFAIINADTVSQLREAGVEIAARQVTFSSTGQKADLWLENGVIHGRRGYLRGKTLAVTDTKLRGPHNAENVMAALAVGSVFAVPRETMVAALRAYQPQPHRMEFVAEINGVTFINDSKATNVDAVGKALQTFTAPVVLIAGGKDKGFDFDSIKPLLKTKVRAAVLVGETRQKIAKSWRDTVPCMQAKTFRDAVWQAATAAQPGDIVLLGPACSSFDMFKNYADRGDTFKQLVNEFAISPEAKAGRRPTASGESVKENTPLPIGANR